MCVCMCVCVYACSIYISNVYKIYGANIFEHMLTESFIDKIKYVTIHYSQCSIVVKLIYHFHISDYFFKYHTTIFIYWLTNNYQYSLNDFQDFIRSWKSFVINIVEVLSIRMEWTSSRISRGDCLEATCFFVLTQSPQLILNTYLYIIYYFLVIIQFFFK